MAPSIFQQIVLPYLSHRSLASSSPLARLFSSGIAQNRASPNAESSPSATAPISPGPSRRWDYIPPISPIPYETGHDPPLQPLRPGTRARIPLSSPVKSSTPDSPSRLGGTAAEVIAFLKSLEEGKGGRQATLMMALEKIASIPDHLVEREAAESERAARRLDGGARPSVKLGNTKVEARTSDDLSTKATIPPSPVEPLQSSTSHELSPVPAGPRLTTELSELLDTPHFPLIIYSLLRTRLYRLTVYHLLLTPEYAVDQPLLDRVAAHMRLDGAGKLARRLDRGWDGTNPDLADGDVPLPHREPFGSTVRRPPDAWQISRRAAARPIPADPALAGLTANYNSHLTRALLSPKKGSSSSSTHPHSSNPLTPLNNMLTSSQPMAKPSGGMRQLRQLLNKIDRLEKHRSFRPDWVTANLVVKCWMNCLMAGGSGWKAGAAGSRGDSLNAKEVEIDKRAELRGLFGFVRALFEKGLEDQAAWERGVADAAAAKATLAIPQPTATCTILPIATQSPNPPRSQSPTGPNHVKPKPYTYPQALSYTRHVRPFANDLLGAFKHIGDMYAVGQVIEWQRDMKARMEVAHPALKYVKGTRAAEFAKRSSAKGM